MKSLIIYMSQHGTTGSIVRLIQNRIGGEVDTINLQDNELPDLEEYDRIVIGASIHMGSIQAKIKKIISENTSLLLRKQLALFMCFMNLEKGEEEFKNNFPEALRNHSVANGLFGGEILFDKMNFMEKLIVKGVAGIRETKHSINTNAIENFISILSHQLQED
jgi:menaquinone-dependent protoporphyrinogen oxidase